MKTHKDLEVWKGSMKLVKEVYIRTSGFPKAEMFGLTDQIRRAAVSVPANISEGSARKNTKEFRQFLRVSFGSLNELETLLIIAADLEYLSKENYLLLFEKIKLLTVQLSSLIKAIEHKIQNQTTLP
ncbi:MAG: four helix bundle protein [Bacteroidetes bacterium]|nr:four helix bundle protein [Bacteroidota bacterium]